MMDIKTTNLDFGLKNVFSHILLSHLVVCYVSWGCWEARKRVEFKHVGQNNVVKLYNQKCKQVMHSLSGAVCSGNVE